MATITYRTCLTRSLRLIGAVANVSTPTADQINQALNVGMEVLDAATGDVRMPFSSTTYQFNFVSGQQSYTVGPTGDWTVSPSRPIRIDGAWTRDNTQHPSTDIAMMQLSDSDFEDIPSKGVTTNIPLYFNYDPSLDNGTIQVWPIPTGTAYAMRFLCDDMFGTSPTLDTVFNYPPAFRKWFVYEVARSLCPEYGFTCPADVQMGAEEGRQVIMQNNYQEEEMEFDTVSGRYDIYSDSTINRRGN